MTNQRTIRLVIGEPDSDGRAAAKFVQGTHYEELGRQLAIKLRDVVDSELLVRGRDHAILDVTLTVDSVSPEPSAVLRFN